jgi:hypothetical protein
VVRDFAAAAAVDDDDMVVVLVLVGRCRESIKVRFVLVLAGIYLQQR